MEEVHHLVNLVGVHRQCLLNIELGWGVVEVVHHLVHLVGVHNQCLLNIELSGGVVEVVYHLVHLWGVHQHCLLSLVGALWSSPQPCSPGRGSPSVPTKNGA